jgi:hypothetical protein
MSKKNTKSKQDYDYLYDEIVNDPKEYSRNKFLRKKSKNKDKKKPKSNLWD